MIQSCDACDIHRTTNTSHVRRVPVVDALLPNSLGNKMVVLKCMLGTLRGIIRLTWTTGGNFPVQNYHITVPHSQSWNERAKEEQTHIAKQNHRAIFHHTQTRSKLCQGKNKAKSATNDELRTSRDIASTWSRSESHPKKHFDREMRRC